MNTNSALLMRVFRAVEQRDAGALIDLYDRAVEFHEAPSLPYGGTYRGLEAVVSHHGAWQRAWDSLQTEPERSVDARVVAAGDDEAVVLWHQKGVGPDGKRLDSPVLGLYRVRNGKLARVQMFYFDSSVVVSFLETATPA